ncbi:hypothetical protein [Leptospira sanjuanensis]|uniref:hypothetical protein n=1 Tax=Leptospira sanjuanensis TaxID=2879643 RepID=UPI001EE98B5D|nr:hypothetical protein [Leptospira sanjuanensis]MCG6167739.1 hypothetical protein [Leptospira sanjuanensis]
MKDSIKGVFPKAQSFKTGFFLLFLFSTFGTCKAKTDGELQILLQSASLLGETKCSCEKIERKEGIDSEELAICLRLLEETQRKYGVYVRKFPETAKQSELVVQKSYAKNCLR